MTTLWAILQAGAALTLLIVLALGFIAGMRWAWGAIMNRRGE